jgi:hypothetical protein
MTHFARCTCGYVARGSQQVKLSCPLCNQQIELMSHEHYGRLAWAELHGCQDPSPQWYEWWLTLVPKYGCNCRSHWAEITATHPPDYANFRQWAIDRHNDVNTRLGKPIWHPENFGE